MNDELKAHTNTTSTTTNQTEPDDDPNCCSAPGDGDSGPPKG
jgi:hypothetical protein